MPVLLLVTPSTSQKYHELSKKPVTSISAVNSVASKKRRDIPSNIRCYKPPKTEGRWRLRMYNIHFTLQSSYCTKPIRKAASSYKMIFLRIKGMLKRTKQAYKRQIFRREEMFVSQMEKRDEKKKLNSFLVFDQKVENAGDCLSCYSFKWKWTSLSSGEFVLSAGQRTSGQHFL